MALIFALLMIWTTCISKSQGELLAPLILSADRLSQCSINTSTEEFAIRNIKLYKTGRSAALADVDLITTVPIDEHLTMFIKVYLWMNGGYKQRYAIPVGPVCTSLKTIMPKIFQQFVKKLSTKGRKDCPLPAGNYSMKEIPAYTDMVLPVPPGKYKVLWSFNRKEVLVGCLHMDVTGVPAKKTKS